MQTDPNWSNFFYDPQTHRVSGSKDFDQAAPQVDLRTETDRLVLAGVTVGLWSHKKFRSELHRRLHWGNFSQSISSGKISARIRFFFCLVVFFHYFFKPWNDSNRDTSVAGHSFCSRRQQGGSSSEIHQDEVPDWLWVKGKKKNKKRTARAVVLVSTLTPAGVRGATTTFANLSSW